MRFNDIGAYKNEWAARSREWRFEKARQEETHIIRENDRDDATLFSGLTDLSSLSRDNSDTNERWWRKRIEDYLKNLSEFIDYCKTYEQPANVYSIYEGIGMVVGLGSRRFFLYQPDSLVAEYVPVKDYSAMSVSEMRALAAHGTSSTLPASVPESLSVSQVREGLSDREAELNALKANIEDTKNGTSDELRALKEEVERAMAALEQKKEKLMAELSAKREALEEQVEMMNNQIYLLKPISVFENIKECFDAQRILPIPPVFRDEVVAFLIGAAVILHQKQCDGVRIRICFLQHPCALATVGIILGIATSACVVIQCSLNQNFLVFQVQTLHICQQHTHE